jgi:CheY-like chemotaxis protein
MPAAPAAPAVPTGRRLPRRPRARRRRRRTVLVIEDEPDFARILYDLAHDMDYRCLVALHGRDGLELAPSNSCPDAILLDMRLPDRSGLSVLQQLKDNPATRHIPVHVVSANDRRGAAPGRDRLCAQADHARAAGRRCSASSKASSRQQIKRVLLVEDDERQRESVVQLIATTTSRSTPSATGEEALALLRTPFSTA